MIKLFSARRGSPGSRRSRRKLRVLRKALTVGAALAACIACGFCTAQALRALQKSGYLNITTIRISGAPDRAALHAVLSDAGIRTGANIFSARLERAAERLSRDPWIASAILRRTLPDTIDITIRMRKPIAVVDMGTYYLLDSQGALFSSTHKPGRRLPIICGLTRQDAVAKKKYVADSLRSAVELITSLRRHDMLRDRAPRIVANASLGLMLDKGKPSATVRLGHDDYDKKIAILKRVQQDLAEKKLDAESISILSVKKIYVSLSS